jgi:gamma-glutamyltranspeptidase/glutathione hydrolase
MRWRPAGSPFHTLNPALAVLADGRILAYGAMGGDGQPQTQAALFTRHVRYRAPLERAIDAPRWLLGRTWGSTHTNLRMESRFDGTLVERLLSAGHDVEMLPDAYSDVMGHAGAVVLHPGGTLEGGHDPRARRRRGRGVAIGPAACRTVIPRLHSAALRDIVPCRPAARRDWRAHP